MIKTLRQFLLRRGGSLIFWVVGVLGQSFLFAFPLGWLGAVLTAWQGRKFYFLWAFVLGLLLDFVQGVHLGQWTLIFLLTGGVVSFIRRQKQGQNGVSKLDLPY